MDVAWRNIVVLMLSLVSAQVVFAQDQLPVRNDTAVYISSKIMGETRTLWIHVPEDYYITKNTYPVLYLLDGDSHFNYGARMADFLAGHDRNRIPEMIVVGVVNVDRQRDFSPVYAKKADGASDSNKVLPDTGLGRFSRYLEQEVVSYVDEHYRVQPYRILEAHSLAGLVALYTKETKPGLFSATILVSPVISPYLIKHIGDFFEGEHAHNGKMFVGLGNENPSGVDAVLSELKRKAPAWFDYSYSNYPDENHFTVPYKTLFDGIKFIYRDWFLDFYGNESITIRDINNRFAKMSAEFGYPISPNEDFLNGCGYYQLRLKQTENAIGIFEANVKEHPDSANAYDSLGEAYMTAGNKALAIKNYERSVELNPRNENGRQTLEKLRSGKLR